MTKKRVTVKDVMSWEPCKGYEREVIKKLFGRKKYLTAIDILRLDIPAKDKLWAVLREDLVEESILHEASCQFAESVLHIFEKEYPEDDRPRKLIEAKRSWLRGDTTDDELRTADADADAVAFSAAFSAAVAFSAAAFSAAAYAAAAFSAASAAADAAFSAATAAAAAFSAASAEREKQPSAGGALQGFC